MVDDGITAHHGSPHDFDEFDTSKIGTGEGAQAYGHGLYFAEHEPIAQHYKDMLSVQGNPTVSARVKQTISDFGGNEDAAKDHIKAAIEHHKNAKNKGSVQFWQTALDQFDNLKRTDLGHMYEVHINAHPDHLLDWDKPLSEQSEHVKRALSNIPHRDKNWLFKDTIETLYAAPHMKDDPSFNLSGQNIYNHIGQGRMVGNKAEGQKSASDILHQHGIKGIKYLDAGSRGANEKPTHNYVIFDDKLVNVKRKYEQGGAVENYEQGGEVAEPPRPKRNFAPVTNGPIVKRAFELLSKDRTGR